MPKLKTYVISMPQSADRREQCFAACKAAGLTPEWFKAVNGRELMERYLKDPQAFAGRVELKDQVTLELGLGRSVKIADKLSASELGCALSHLELYEKIAAGDEPYALILEDDCLLKPAVREAIPLILEQVAKWDVVQILHDSGIRDFFIKRRFWLDKSQGWYLNHEGMSALDPIFNRRRASFLACAYIVTRKAAARLTNIGFPARLPADYLLGLTAFNKLRIYTLYPQEQFGKADNFASTINLSNDSRPQHRLS